VGLDDLGCEFCLRSDKENPAGKGLGGKGIDFHLCGLQGVVAGAKRPATTMGSAETTGALLLP